MSTITSGNGKSFFQGINKKIRNFIEAYCPDGQTCNDIATIGSLVFMVAFMYIAMEPLFVFR